MVWTKILDSILRRGVLPLILLTASMLRYNLISLLYLLLLMVCVVLPRPILRHHKCFNVVCFVVLMCVSLIGTLGQPLFQFTLLANSTYHLTYCSVREATWRQFGFIQFIRPDSKPVPAVDIIRHYLPDVVVFITTVVTMVIALIASRKPNGKPRGGRETLPRRQQRDGEEVVGNELEAEGAAGANPAEVDLGGPGVREAAPVRLDRLYWRMPPVVVHTLDLAIFVMMGACGVAVPSLTSLVYFLIFLLKAVLWALHLDGWNRRLSVRALLLVFTGCHIVMVYLYQFETAQELIPLKPTNTTASLLGRLFGLTPFVCTSCARPTELMACPDVPSNYIISPVFLCILFWLVATDLTLWLSTPVSLWRFKHTYYLLQVQTTMMEHAVVDMVSEGPEQPVAQTPAPSSDPQAEVQPPAPSSDPSAGVQWDQRSNTQEAPLSDLSFVHVKEKGKSLYKLLKKGLSKKAMAVWRALMRVNFVFSIVAMMLWSVFYPCWLSLVLLLWACVIWIIPRLNPRLSLYYTSPFLVFYTLGLLCLQYVYSLQGPDLPRGGSVIVIRPRIEDRSFHLALEAVFVLLFLASLHEFMTMVKERFPQNQTGMSQYGAIILISRAESPNTTNGAVDLGSHLYSTVFQLLSAYWVVVVFGAFLLVIMAGGPNWLKAVYIIVFYISLLFYQLFRSYWYHLVTPLWSVMVVYAMLHLLLVYTAQFEVILNVWTKAFNGTGANTNYLFQSIGMLKYDPGNTRSLFETLVPLAVFIAVLAMQLRYFMFQKAATDTTDFSLVESIVDYFRPRREDTTIPPPGPDQLDAGVEGGISLSSSSRTVTLSQQSSSSSTHEKVYRLTRSLVVRLRQLVVSLIYLTWRFLALHTHKVAMLTLFITSLSQISAAYLVLLLMTLVASPLPRLHRVLYPLLTLYLGLLATAKMVYQAPLLQTQHFNLSTNCNTSGVQSNITGTGMVFSDRYSPLSNDPSWFGLHKVASGSNFGSYIVGPILAALVLSLWISAQRYQDHYYRTDHILLGPHDRSALFLGVTYQNAEESLVEACKYLTNHFFEMYGLETCWSMLAIAVAIHIDVYGIFYALVLGLLMVVPRRPHKILFLLWTSYLVLHGLLLGFQYAFLLGVPQGVCLSPGTSRDYPWRNMTSPLKKWLFLTQSNQQILDKNLLYADILIYLLLCFQLRYTSATRGSDQTDGAMPRIFDLAVWFDYIKIFVFQYGFWLALFLIFLFATLQISLFGWLYLLACFVFMFRGQSLLKETQSHRKYWWSAFRTLVWFTLLVRVTLQVVDCVYTKRAVPLYRILFNGNCNRQLYYGSIHHPDDTYNVGLWTDALCFILLTLQTIIVDTKYAEAVKVELVKKDETSMSFAAIMKERIAENQTRAVQARTEELLKLDERMTELSEQLNTIEHVLHARVKIPAHITRRYGRKSLPKALLRSQGIQDDTPSPEKRGLSPGRGPSAAEDEPKSKDGAQEGEGEGKELSVPLCTKVATFLMTVADMLIGWLNRNSEDYRYVVQRVRRRKEGGAGGAEMSCPGDVAGNQVEKVEARGDVIVEALHLEPSAAEKEEAGTVERELIGAAEKRLVKMRLLLVALYYCFLAHSEFVVYFMVILNVLLNGSVLSLVYAFLMFCWGLLSFPWPTRKFWVVLTFYTVFVILVRYAFQFKQADMDTSCQVRNLDQGRCPTQIVGIYYYGRSFYSHVVWDFLLLVAVFVHTALLKEYGLWVQTENEGEAKNSLAELWEDFKAFLSHLNRSSNMRALRGGKDYYTIMLFFDLLVFITIVFGASSFGIATAQGQEGVVQVISLVQSNTVPIGFVVFLLIQFLSMLLDRAIYLRHSIRAKFAFHLLLLTGWHVWLFFALPNITKQAFSSNVAAQFIYFFKCFYFIVSSLQIIQDYPVQCVGWFLRGTYNLVSSTLFTIYRVIPLLPELREMIDWVFTDTVLDIFQWLTVQKLWYLVYQIKNRREQEKREVRLLGTPPSLLVKIIYGGVLVLLFVALIWGPLFFFSLVTATGSFNPPTAMSIEVSLDGFQTLLTSRQLNISDLSKDQYQKLMDLYDEDIPQFASIYNVQNFQKVLISSQPASVWVISPPARDQLVTKVYDTLQKNGSLNVIGSWTISRSPLSTTAQLQVSGQNTLVVNGSTLQEFFCSLNQTDPSCNGVSSTVMLKDLFPCYVYSPATGASTSIAQLAGYKGGYASFMLSLSSSGSAEWWTLKVDSSENCTLQVDSTGIDLLVYSDRVAAGVFSSIAGIGVIGLYVSIVFAIGRIIHSYVEGLPFSLIFDEILSPDVLWQLLEDIYLVRNRRKFDLEEILVGRLFAVIRSPESIIQLTEFEKPKRD